MDKVFNCLIFKYRLLATKDEARIQTDFYSCICNAKSEEDAVECALRQSNLGAGDKSDYDVEVFAHEFNAADVEKLLNEKKEFIMKVKQAVSIKGSPRPHSASG